MPRTRKSSSFSAKSIARAKPRARNNLLQPPFGAAFSLFVPPRSFAYPVFRQRPSSHPTSLSHHARHLGGTPGLTLSRRVRLLTASRFKHPAPGETVADRFLPPTRGRIAPHTTRFGELRSAV